MASGVELKRLAAVRAEMAKLRKHALETLGDKTLPGRGEQIEVLAAIFDAAIAAAVVRDIPVPLVLFNASKHMEAAAGIYADMERGN